MTDHEKKMKKEINQLKKMSCAETMYTKMKNRLYDNTKYAIVISIFVPIVIADYACSKMFKKKEKQDA